MTTRIVEEHDAPEGTQYTCNIDITVGDETGYTYEIDSVSDRMLIVYGADNDSNGIVFACSKASLMDMLQSVLNALHTEYGEQATEMWLDVLLSDALSNLNYRLQGPVQ